MRCQVLQAGAVEEVAVINRVHEVPELPKARSGIHRNCGGREGRRDVYDALQGNF